MPLAHNTVSPARFAYARHNVLNASADSFHPAIAAEHWAILKQARGQSVNFDVLALPAHLILQTPAPALPAAPADLDQARIAARIRRHIAIMGYTPHNGGDAA